jgi:hypothetical protein
MPSAHTPTKTWLVYGGTTPDLDIWVVPIVWYASSTSRRCLVAELSKQTVRLLCDATCTEFSHDTAL